MTNKFVIYCAASFTAPSGSPIALAMVAPDGQWLHAEVLDFDLADCDQRALDVHLPLMRRIPGTHFVRGANLATMLHDFVRALSKAGEVEFRFSALSEQTRDLLDRLLVDLGRPSSLKPVHLDPAHFDDFQRHCGGVEKTDGHALIEAIGAALCDVHREIPTNFHDASIYHLELLLGSKNAMSYRAWARAEERRWESLHQAAA